MSIKSLFASIADSFLSHGYMIPKVLTATTIIHVQDIILKSKLKSKVKVGLAMFG